MISQFRSKPSIQQQSKLKASILRDIKNSLPNSDSFVGMLTEAKNLHSKYSQIPPEAENIIQDNVKQEAIVQVNEQSQNLTQSIDLEESVQEMPALVFVNPPKELKKRRQQQVTFEPQENETRLTIKQSEPLSQENDILKAAIIQLKGQQQLIDKENLGQLERENNLNKQIIQDQISKKLKQDMFQRELEGLNLDYQNQIKQLENDKNGEIQTSHILRNQIENFKKYEVDKQQAREILSNSKIDLQGKIDSYFNNIISLKEKLNIQSIQAKQVERESDLQHLEIDQLSEKVTNLELQLEGQSKINSQLQQEVDRLIEKESQNQIQNKVLNAQNKVNQTTLQQPLGSFLEMTEARNETVQINKKLLENEEYIRQLNTQNEILAQRESIYLDQKKENLRLKDEINLLEAELEKQKRANRIDLEASCLQRDINTKREQLMNNLEDELNQKQLSLTLESQNLDKYKNTIEELKNMIKNREITIANLHVDNQKYQQKMDEDLAIAKDRLQIEQMKSCSISKNSYQSPFTIPQINSKFQRQYV